MGYCKAHEKLLSFDNCLAFQFFLLMPPTGKGIKAPAGEPRHPLSCQCRIPAALLLQAGSPELQTCSTEHSPEANGQLPAPVSPAKPHLPEGLLRGIILEENERRGNLQHLTWVHLISQGVTICLYYHTQEKSHSAASLP